MNVSSEAELSRRRIQAILDECWSAAAPADCLRESFQKRLDLHWEDIFRLLLELYGHRYDFFFHLQEIVRTAANSWIHRPEQQKRLDAERIIEPDWYLSENMVGGALYVDLFSENLGKLRECIPYFQELGLTYIHLMPLFAVRPGDNDGGYAISNYRSVDPRLGTIDQLRDLAADLREAGITLVLDFVFNHTADDHEWAQKAQAGDREFEQYYFLFDDRTLPDQYEATLREIFPTVRRGNFSWHDGMSKWVWTTFNNYQWDLNYSNPAVFRAMLEELLFIAATGVDVVRLDAIAFVWKRMGTSCENLPEAHTLVQAFNRLCRVAAPGLIFKSEAIVHPDEVVKYVSERECQLSYNPTLMALLWESLATRKTELLEQSLSHRHTLPPQTTWVNYLRCHDDIGWTFDDEDAAQLGINAYDHRQFLNAFYTGRFPGSFARGIPFQENEETGDVRIAGTLASLAGLELAVDHNDTIHQKLALRRIELLQAVMFSAGGIPLLYLGEEWGLLNDYEFVKDPAKASDARWVHRPKMNWDFPERLEERGQADGDDWRVQIFRRLQHLIRLRKSLPALRVQDLHLLDIANPHVLAFAKIADAHRLAVVGNFSEQEQSLDSQPIRAAIRRQPLADVISGRRLETSDQLTLSPYEVLWVHSPR